MSVDQNFTSFKQVVQQFIRMVVDLPVSAIGNGINLLFRASDNLVNALESKSAFQPPDIAMIASENSFLKTLRNTHRYFMRHKWISISVSTWPEANLQQVKVVPFF